MPTKKTKNKEKQPCVPTQRLVIAMSQRKRRQPHTLIQRHDTALKHRKRTLAHVHITHQRKKRYVPSCRRDKYALSEPKSVIKDAYIKDLESHLLGNTKVKSNLIKSFKKQQTVVKRVTGKAVCSVAAKRLVTKALQVRKEHAGSLLKIVRTVQSMQIKGAEDFGEGCHTASTEPYFYDSAYEPVKRDYALIANRQKLKVCVGQ